MKRLKKKKRICYEKLHLRKTFIKIARKRQDTLGFFFYENRKIVVYVNESEKGDNFISTFS